MLTVESELMPNHSPWRSASFATARSPCQWKMRCRAVGESISGSDDVRPMIVHEGSTLSAPTSTSGTRSTSP